MSALRTQGLGKFGDLPNRMEPALFAARGVVPVAYAAFAFMLGVLLGILLRRMLAAMAVTLVALAVVLVAVPFLIRPHLLPPTRPSRSPRTTSGASTRTARGAPATASW